MNTTLNLSSIIIATLLIVSLFSACDVTLSPPATLHVRETLPLNDPNHDNCVVLTVLNTPESEAGFTVYRGAIADDSFAFPHTAEESLKSQIGEYVEQTLTTEESKIGILIECDNKVTNGAVEIVKAGVWRSTTSSDRPLFVGILDDGNRKD